MAAISSSNLKVRRFRRVAVYQALTICLLGIGVVFGALYFLKLDAAASTEPEVSVDSRDIGKSGFPVPRFVSLKADRVNVRRGPSTAHGIDRVFTKEGLPVEVVREFDVWRRVRYLDGVEGWVHKVMLTGRRSGMIRTPSAGNTVSLIKNRRQPATAVAHLEAGVQVSIMSCDHNWCDVSADGYRGFLPKSSLWGVYSFERF